MVVVRTGKEDSELIPCYAIYITIIYNLNNEAYIRSRHSEIGSLGDLRSRELAE
jgi:hypothetical protein